MFNDSQFLNSGRTREDIKKPVNSSSKQGGQTGGNRNYKAKREQWGRYHPGLKPQCLIQTLSAQHFQTQLWIRHKTLPKGIRLDAQRKHQLLEDATLSLTGIYIHAPHQSLRYKHVAEKRGNCRKFTRSSSLRDYTCCDNLRELSLQTKITSHSPLPFQHAHLYHFSYYHQADTKICLPSQPPMSNQAAYKSSTGLFVNTST